MKTEKEGRKFLKKIKKEIKEIPKDLSEKERLDFLSPDSIVDLINLGIPISRVGEIEGIIGFLNVKRSSFSKWLNELDPYDRGEIELAINTQILAMKGEAVIGMRNCIKELKELDEDDEDIDFHTKSEKISMLFGMQEKFANALQKEISEDRKDSRTKQNSNDKVIQIMVQGNSQDSEKEQQKAIEEFQRKRGYYRKDESN